jgi:Family of unknown function (DUF6491)
MSTALLSSACATSGLSRDERVAVYRAHAGEPISSFRVADRTLSWRALSDDALIVWTRSNQANLLEFSPRCIGLRSARTIDISNSRGLVSVQFDSVRIIAPATATRPNPTCRITAIRPLDLQAINDFKLELREAQTMQIEPTDLQKP